VSWGLLFRNPLPRRVTVIGCGKEKLPGRHKAQDLYTGNLFRASLKYAKATSSEVYIASANYGLIGLDDVVDSYDLVITDLSKTSRELWAQEVARELRSKLQGGELVLMMGAEYVKPLAKELARFDIPFAEPLKGLQLGERLHWLKEHTP
jgi:hypothetical protein